MKKQLHGLNDHLFYCSVVVVSSWQHTQGQWNQGFMEGNVQCQLTGRSDVTEHYWALQSSDKSGREVV